MNATNLVADAERQLSAQLALLSAAADGDYDDATRRQFNGAANHVSCALQRLANIKPPARSVPTTTPPGGLGPKPLSGSEGGRAGAAARPAGPGADFHLPPIPTVPSFDNGPDAGRFALRERENRLIGSVEFTAGSAMYRART